MNISTKFTNSTLRHHSDYFVRTIKAGQKINELPEEPYEFGGVKGIFFRFEIDGSVMLYANEFQRDRDISILKHLVENEEDI